MEPIPLTARQMKFWAEIQADEIAANRTLKAALGYHSNAVQEILKDKKKWWDEFIAAHKLDRKKIYAVDQENRQVVVREKTNSEAEAIALERLQELMGD